MFIILIFVGLVKNLGHDSSSHCREERDKQHSEQEVSGLQLIDTKLAHS
jgi:hypothetical protein